AFLRAAATATVPDSAPSARTMNASISRPLSTLVARRPPLDEGGDRFLHVVRPQAHGLPLGLDPQPVAGRDGTGGFDGALGAFQCQRRLRPGPGPGLPPPPIH